MTPEARSLSVAADRNNQNELRALICERVRRAAAEALVELQARQRRERRRHEHRSIPHGEAMSPPCWHLRVRHSTDRIKYTIRAGARIES